MHLPTGCRMADSEFSIIFSHIQPRCSSFTLFIISYHVTKFYFNQVLAPYSTISPHPTTLSPHSSNATHPDSLKNNGLKQSTIFTSHIARTRTVGNQFFCFPSISKVP